MIDWDEELCDQLAEQGLNVIRFDNRDVGLSSMFDEAGVPNIVDTVAAYQLGEEVKVPYTLEDMAADAVGLLDALNIEKAHMCGGSMGGMIAQLMAIRYPSRVSSLISMMSSTGAPELPRGKPEAMAVFMAPPPSERNAYIEHVVNNSRIMADPKALPDENLLRSQIQRSYDRCFHPEGMARQMIAVVTAGDRTQALKSVTALTLVIHGSGDTLLPVEHGEATARAIPGAELLIVDGMGHGMAFPEVWPRWVEAIAAHIRKSEAQLG